MRGDGSRQYGRVACPVAVAVSLAARAIACRQQGRGVALFAAAPRGVGGSDGLCHHVRARRRRVGNRGGRADRCAADHADDCADRNRLPYLHGDLGQYARFIRGDLDVGLVGFDLGNGVARLDKFALSLQPRVDRAFFHAVAHLGHCNFCHASSFGEIRDKR